MWDMLAASVAYGTDKQRKALANPPLIRVQAFGEALDPNRLEKWGR